MINTLTDPEEVTMEIIRGGGTLLFNTVDDIQSSMPAMIRAGVLRLINKCGNANITVWIFNPTVTLNTVTGNYRRVPGMQVRTSAYTGDKIIKLLNDAISDFEDNNGTD